jgi:uncharacterized protein YdaU (DUF1376 family)
MPAYLGDVLKATQFWSGEERALYVLLRMSQWERGSLPSDPVRIAHGLQYNVENFLALWATVGEKFTLTDKGLVDLDLEAFRARVVEVSRIRKEIGAVGGRSNALRWQRIKAEREANEKQTGSKDGSKGEAKREAKEKQEGKQTGSSNPIQSNPILSNPNSKTNRTSAPCEASSERKQANTNTDKQATDDAIATQAFDAAIDLQAQEATEASEPEPPAPDPLDVEFEQLQRAYPKRAGGQRWTEARKALNARKREGHSFADILAGVERYAKFIRATGKERTEYVQQAATFLGTNRGFLETWDNAPNKAERQQSRTIDAALSWIAEEEQRDAERQREQRTERAAAQWLADSEGKQ